MCDGGKAGRSRRRQQEQRFGPEQKQCLGPRDERSSTCYAVDMQDRDGWWALGEMLRWSEVGNGDWNLPAPAVVPWPQGAHLDLRRLPDGLLQRPRGYEPVHRVALPKDDDASVDNNHNHVHRTAGDATLPRSEGSSTLAGDSHEQQRHQLARVLLHWSRRRACVLHRRLGWLVNPPHEGRTRCQTCRQHEGPRGPRFRVEYRQQGSVPRRATNGQESHHFQPPLRVECRRQFLLGRHQDDVLQGALRHHRQYQPVVPDLRGHVQGAWARWEALVQHLGEPRLRRGSVQHPVGSDDRIHMVHARRKVDNAQPVLQPAHQLSGPEFHH
mmetsp:Transcript_92875/g.262276  ORF Transcript_92875/g.262276 Transcript_92875/m.262276 type:complete len:327 (+) Transcript_92875:184-1164(+)